jgi:hypothetical protein
VLLQSVHYSYIAKRWNPFSQATPRLQNELEASNANAWARMTDLQKTWSTVTKWCEEIENDRGNSNRQKAPNELSSPSQLPSLYDETPGIILGNPSIQLNDPPSPYTPMSILTGDTDVVGPITNMTTPVTSPADRSSEGSTCSVNEINVRMAEFDSVSNGGSGLPSEGLALTGGESLHANIGEQADLVETDVNWENQDWFHECISSTNWDRGMMFLDNQHPIDMESW